MQFSCQILGEGEDNKKEGLKPLLDTPIKQVIRKFAHYEE